MHVHPHAFEFEYPRIALNYTRRPEMAENASAANVISDVTQTLQTFDLLDLQQYTREKSYSSTASKDFHLFYVGRDDVHNILKYILSRASISLYMNMFGFDDEELNAILMQQALDPSITMMITLDRSQASVAHEKNLLTADMAQNPAKFNTYFVIGESQTHQISHTKGFVADGKVGGEGSVNWSKGGEGIFVVTGAPGGPGYLAQNNTQTIFTDPDTINRFQTQLIAEHMIAKAQGYTLAPAAATAAPATKAAAKAATKAPAKKAATAVTAKKSPAAAKRSKRN
ncbi:MAG TPA: hypothetical protein VJU59_35515 [Paraburkholderia sp.]|uniref:hypothetical protein n=1 Tax=Paraburkholderia sp. TaxID=1926495 RepID=UPI002B477C39|nr:hypothetical protein [Paraburkholderia sp.]HKR44922.1 hypothetical protein [Paraburkholderia sp.]